MAIATRPGQTWPYILRRERVPDGAKPEEAQRIKAEQTVWKLGHVSLTDRAALEDQAYLLDAPTKQVTSSAGSNRLTVLRLGLKGFENFRVREDDGKLTQVEWQTRSAIELGRRRDVPTDEILDLIDPEDRDELAEAIKEGQRLTTEEKKG